MLIDGISYRTIWCTDDGAVEIIDQTRLPHVFETLQLKTLSQMVHAIKEMWVRGAPLIGAAAAWGMALAMREANDDAQLEAAAIALCASRPTAVNLRWAVERMLIALRLLPPLQRAAAAQHLAETMCDEDVALNRAIGRHGFALLKSMHEHQGRPLRILTRCKPSCIAMG